jgi:phage terminase large subunit
VGGAGSSKSHSVAQFLIRKFYEDNDIRILITRKTTPSLRISAYKLITDLLREYGWPFNLNKTELVITPGQQ